jgi:hypothetical protein
MKLNKIGASGNGAADVIEIAANNLKTSSSIFFPFFLLLLFSCIT